MKHLSLFWKIYLAMTAMLVLSALGVYTLDRWSEGKAVERAEAEFEVRRSRLGEMLQTMAEEFDRLVDISASDDNREVILSWVRRQKLDKGLDIYVALSDSDAPDERFSLRVQKSRVHIAPPLAATAKSSSGRTTLYAAQEPYEDWDELETPIPGKLFSLMILSGAIISYFVVRHLMIPLRELEKATARMAQGDFSLRIGDRAVAGHDELRRLGAAFNVMAGYVEQSLANQKQLLIDVSHEVRSPLQRLSVALSLIEEKGRDSVPPIPMEQAKRDIRRIDAMVEELLALIRSESAAELEQEPVSMKPLLQTLIALENFEEKRIELKGEDVYVCGDARLLSRAVRNVIHNAMRYSPANGEVEVVLTEEGNEAILVVRDHGPGVSEDELEKIFLPFYRTESACEQIGNGIGLGLPLVRRIVGKHGGSCIASNAPDGGLIMTLRLPLYRVEPEIPGESAAAFAI